MPAGELKASEAVESRNFVLAHKRHKMLATKGLTLQENKLERVLVAG